MSLPELIAVARLLLWTGIFVVVLTILDFLLCRFVVAVRSTFNALQNLFNLPVKVLAAFLVLQLL